MPVNCYVCRRVEATRGVSCAACCDRLATDTEIRPEQITRHGDRGGSAALVDRFGNQHELFSPRTALGRSIETDKIVVLEPSVSRRHAELERRRDRSWTVRDLGSTCGTFVNGRSIAVVTPLRDGDRVRFGDVELYFIQEAGPPLPNVKYEVPTYRLPANRLPSPEPRRSRGTRPPTTRLELHAPSGGGGGLAVIDGKRVQLTTAQYELVDLLVARMSAEAAKPPANRGFVSMTELLKLSLEVPDPGVDHVRQLVHRVRRALVKANVGDLIEVRRGTGYRLRVTSLALHGRAGRARRIRTRLGE